MLGYLIRRCCLALPLLLGITLISFVVLHLAPGEPEVVGQDLQAEASSARQSLRQLYGLDQPLWVQYGRWFGRLVRLDFGRSFAPDGRPVLAKIAERVPLTLTLNLLQLAVTLGVAVPIGVLAATRRGSWFDRGTTLFVFVGFATPDFWFALLLMLLFGVELGWLPISGIRSLNFEYLPFWGQVWDLVSHIILPVGVVAVHGLAFLSRFMRGSMLEVIRQEYVRTARAKGLSERQVLGRHALRNALLPVVTILGLSIPGLLSGSVIIETIFALPGMGQLFVQSAFSRDYPVLMGLIVIGATLTLLGNILADVAYALVDPRIQIAGPPRG